MNSQKAVRQATAPKQQPQQVRQRAGGCAHFCRDHCTY
jgi:hypothetical protein